MPLIVFLRGVNVGGHRTFRPTLLAQKLRDYDVVNVGAAGTFVVWKPGPRAKFLSALQHNLPFEAKVAICDARDLLKLLAENPFGTQPPPPRVVRFITILPKTLRTLPPLPVAFPSSGRWLLRIIEVKGRFVLGEYRRHMKTIGYFGQIDKLFGTNVTTRNWNTITTLLRLLSK